MVGLLKQRCIYEPMETNTQENCLADRLGNGVDRPGDAAFSGTIPAAISPTQQLS
jgi:hypothetical protein